VILGSSVDVLPTILDQLEGPALFWLNAHPKPGDAENVKSGEIPALREVELILHHRDAADHVILIDDARFFTGSGGYPSIGQLAKRVTCMSGGHDLRVYNDAIHLYSSER
jgi:hypothetical protein